jgi:hypothetical protein
MQAFEQFCKDHPQLVRRLHDKLGYESPEEVVEFLVSNEKLPCLYEDEPKEAGRRPQNSRLKRPEDQFPVIAPRSKFSPDEPTTGDILPDDYNNHDVARGWYAWAQDVVPPPDIEAGPMAQFIYDRRKYRMPKSPQLIIFRHYPARAQAYVAEFLEKDGWFDEGWHLDEAFALAPFAKPGERVGRGTAGEAWAKAHAMYRDYGEKNGLYLDPLEYKNLKEKAERYYDMNPGVNSDWLPETLPAPTSPADLPLIDAHKRLFRYNSFRRLTNYAHFYFRSQVEAMSEAVKARRHFYEADLLRKRATSPEKALKLYEDPEALKAWRKILIEHPDFRVDEFVQEESYEIQKKYLTLARNVLGIKRVEAFLNLQQCLARGTLCPPVGPERWLIPRKLLNVPTPGRRGDDVLTATVFKGPFDDPDPDNAPLLLPESKQEVEKRDMQGSFR